MTLDVGGEVALAVRVAAAAIAGALIGLEREVHSHPAGTRTHLLVAAGAAAFTILSMFGFGDVLGDPHVVLDPSRVAAQIVSGIGFIGGGAILKYGVSIRGLTTAGSLWATAAVGFAFGSGLFVLGTLTAMVIVFSLWPLALIVERFRADRRPETRIRLALARLETLGSVYETLMNEHVEILGLGSQRVAKNRYEVDLRLQLPQRLRLPDVELRLASLPEVDVVMSTGASY